MVVEMPIFTAQAAKLFSDEQKHKLIDFLAYNPEAGEIVPGTGGIRKVRVPMTGQGKRGGARVIYYFMHDDAPIYAILVYAKNVRADMTAAQKREAAALTAALKSLHRRT